MIRKIKKRLSLAWVAAVLLLTAATGCDSALKDAYENFLDNTPPICKDYCEEQAACGRMSGTGEYEQEQFASDVHVCEVQCGAYAAEGAFAWYPDPNNEYDRVVFDYLSGDEVMDIFSCLYGKGAYRCVIRDGDYSVEFSPPARNICEVVNECVDDYDLKLNYSWLENSEGLGGSCQQSGGDFIDAVFF